MLTAYVFSLVVGGGFMALSVLGDLFGGADVGDVDLDVDLDIDLDVDVDMDGGGGATGAFKILSLRTVVYALFGFGAVGTSLTRFWGAEAVLQTAVYATVGAALTGLVGSAFFGFMKRSATGDRLGDDSFVGLSGKVTLPLSAGSVGKVKVFRGDRGYTLRALAHGSVEDVDPGTWADVVVVEMDGGVARVIPVDDPLLLPSDE